MYSQIINIIKQNANREYIFIRTSIQQDWHDNIGKLTFTYLP